MIIFEFLIFFIVELPNLNAKDLYDNDDFMLAFVKEPSKVVRIDGWSEKDLTDLTQKYEAYLGIVYLLRNNWHCENIDDAFEEYEQDECLKYRKYLDIVYEYLFLNYAGIPAVKPMFYLGQTFTFCKLTETVKSLTLISKFYFNSEFGKSKGHKLATFFVIYNEPKLFNENELNYEGNYEKITFQEAIVQMGFALKWENEIGKSHLDLIKPPKFDKILEEMLKKAEKESVLSNRASPGMNTAQFNKRDILLLHSSFEETYNTFNHDVFLAFLRGKSDFEQICSEMQNERILRRIGNLEGGTFEEYKEYLSQNSETILGHLYLMRQNWNCDKMVAHLKKDEQLVAQCEKNGKNLNLFHEYLFKIYAKIEVPELALQFPIVRPLFDESPLPFVSSLYNKSIRFFDARKSEYRMDRNDYNAERLLNEDKFVNYNYEKEDFGILIKTLRQKFDNKLKTMYEKARNDEKMHKWRAIGQLEELRKSPFYERLLQKEDEAFIAFMKGQSNFEHFCKLVTGEEVLSICKGLTKSAVFVQKKKHLMQKYEAHLGVVYLMRENWKCDKIGEKEQTECQKYRKYLDIFYFELFRLNAEDDPESAFSLLLIRKVQQFGTLIDVIKYFNRISKWVFHSKSDKTKKYDKLEEVFGNSKSPQSFEQIFAKTGKNEAKTKGMKKKDFDQQMEERLKRSKEMAAEERAKLNKMNEKMKYSPKNSFSYIEEEELKKKMDAFRDKFGILFISPFYGTTRDGM